MGKELGETSFIRTEKFKEIQDFSLILWSIKADLDIGFREIISALEKNGWTVNFNGTSTTDKSLIELEFIRGDKVLKYDGGTLMESYELASQDPKFQQIVIEATNPNQNLG